MRSRIKRAIVAAALGMAVIAGCKFAKREPLAESRMMRGVSMAPLVMATHKVQPAPVKSVVKKKPRVGISCSEIIKRHKRSKNRLFKYMRIHQYSTRYRYDGKGFRRIPLHRMPVSAVYRLTLTEKEGKTNGAYVKRLYDSRRRLIKRERSSYTVHNRPLPCMAHCLSSISAGAFELDRYKHNGKDTNVLSKKPGCALTIVYGLRNGMVISAYIHGNKPWPVSRK